MTVKQAAERLEVSQSTVYALIAAGKLPCHRIGIGRGVIRITEDHIQEFIRASGATVAPPPPPRYVPKHVRVRTS